MIQRHFPAIVLSAILAVAAILAVPVFVSEAADASGRADVRKLEGQKNNVQDMFTRMTEPVWVNGSLLYIITNRSDGLIFVKSNATVLAVVSLPNPTNNVGRVVEVHTIDAVTVRLTNQVAGSIFEMHTATNSTVGLFVQSNKTAICISTGTNWFARLY